MVLSFEQILSASSFANKDKEQSQSHTEVLALKGPLWLLLLDTIDRTAVAATQSVGVEKGSAHIVL